MTTYLIAMVGVGALVRAFGTSRSASRARRSLVGPSSGVTPVGPPARQPVWRSAVAWWVARRRRRADAAIDRALPDLVAATAREVRAGRTVGGALLAASDTADPSVVADVMVVRRRLDAGASLHDALQAWVVARPTVGVRHLVAVLGLGASLGGEVAPALDAAATAMRNTLDVRAEAVALTAQSRASARLLTALPPVAALGLGMVEPESLRFLVATPPGWWCVGLATVLAGLGWVWMHALMERV